MEKVDVTTKLRTRGKRPGRKPKPANERYDEPQQIRLNKELKRKLKEAVRNSGDDSVSVYIRRLIVRHLRKLESGETED